MPHESFPMPLQSQCLLAICFLAYLCPRLINYCFIRGSSACSKSKYKFGSSPSRLAQNYPGLQWLDSLPFFISIVFHVATHFLGAWTSTHSLRSIPISFGSYAIFTVTPRLRIISVAALHKSTRCYSIFIDDAAVETGGVGGDLSSTAYSWEVAEIFKLIVPSLSILSKLVTSVPGTFAVLAAPIVLQLPSQFLPLLPSDIVKTRTKPAFNKFLVQLVTIPLCYLRLSGPNTLEHHEGVNVCRKMQTRANFSCRHLRWYTCDKIFDTQHNLETIKTQCFNSYIKLLFSDFQ